MGRRSAAAFTALAVSALLVRPAAAVPCPGGPVPTCAFNDYGAFTFSNGGALRLIDFETRPDGLPTQGGEYITPDFNYTAQGVTFSTPVEYPRLLGPPGHRGLDAFLPDPILRDWINADLVVPSRAVGIWFPGGTQLFAYDSAGNLLADPEFSSSGDRFFLGVVSDIPIARVIVDRGSNAEDVEDFVFNPTPEPATALLFAPLAWLLSRRAARQLKVD